MDVENCENCKAKTCKEPESVPYIVHEASMARMERQAKRLWIAVLLLIVLLVGTNAAWLFYKAQFKVQTSETVTTTTNQTAEATQETAQRDSSVDISARN